MPTGRSTRILIAAVLLIIALFLAMNYLVEARSIVDWWLPLLLLAVAIGVTQVDRLRREEAATVPGASPVVYSMREYVFPGSASAPALAGPEQAGEVNVREPRDEVESEPIIEAPETMTPPEKPVEEEPPAEPVIPAPETETPPAPDVIEEQPKTEEQRAADDFETGGAFAPPSSIEGALNPPTESDTVAGAVVQHETPIQEHDPAAHETPVTRITEPPKPPESQAERLEKDGELLQPADTAENEFQDGEHVAANQPARSAPTTVTTGPRAGEGEAPLEPQKKAVLDTTAAPVQPHSQEGVEASQPEVADAVLSGRESPATAEGLAPSDAVQASPAAPKVTGGPDDLTVVVGIGPKMQAALRAADINTFAQLAAASEEQVRAAIEAGGMRLAPTLSTWSQQAGFLARGDRAGFEALVAAMRGEGTAPEDLDEE